MSVSPAQNFLKPSPVPGPSTVYLKSGLAAAKASATPVEIGSTVDEPETLIGAGRRRRRCRPLAAAGPDAAGVGCRGAALAAGGRGAAAAAGGDEQRRGEREAAEALGRCDGHWMTPPEDGRRAVRRWASWSRCCRFHASVGGCQRAMCAGVKGPLTLRAVQAVAERRGR